MELVYKSLGAIIGFTAIVLIIQTVAGEKAAQNMTLLILASILILNSTKVVDFADMIGGKK